MIISETTSFGGRYLRVSHASSTLNCEMTYGLFLPPEASEDNPAPVLYWLSGLTCTDENFMQKAGAHRLAAELGIAILAPDTSPRGEGVPDDPDGSYDLGLGAGFYLNATKPPWSSHYHMFDYVLDELPAVVKAQFPISDVWSIAGHSMGGHGALVLGLRHPYRFRSISAFAPIVNPSACPWGHKAFQNYLGDDEARWHDYDACHLLSHLMEEDEVLPLLIDQGDADQFLEQQLLLPNLDPQLDRLQCSAEIRIQPGYDHSYYFIASFIDDHLRFHADYLFAQNNGAE
ncbi:S-formylglutathione hydrolase [Corallincola platygyrae]|uniref:S-formylglutathione hydrolase n=1 Tax=Corallincola platygyrae TaxID=1193278 RepID=A0ABW4XJR4_9GAMM